MMKIAQLESSLVPVVSAMERAGIPLDVERWAELVAQREHEAEDARDRVRSALAIENPSSPKQLAPALQRHLGTSITATNAEALAPFAEDPVVQDLQTFRTAQSFIKCHGHALLEKARASGDGRVRASWRQLGAPTGRMACSDPNLLGLPKAREVRACIVATPGNVLVVADYATIELRILAEVADDERLISIFASGGDPHRAMAAMLTGKPEHEITKEERKRAKPVNFGFPYSLGPARFVSYARKDYGVVFTEQEATEIRRTYWRTYPGVYRWQQLTRSRMELTVSTLGGRVRRFDSREHGYGERLNTPVQGTGADGLKHAMVLLFPRLAALGARFILAVHDELVVEAPEDRADEVKAVVVAGMIGGMRQYVTRVPITVEARVGPTWAEDD